ncbi:cysteine desulfurase [Aeromicrobium camelliae]|uniref:Cysteine desulfurase n=2 Tax=Aeromicrobium TaxID=2040 RepID=A0A3N6ZLU1_9ACTN|nr:cysteine desulfurase family protein [Aeromicrobium camelliae]RQN07987.1 cysteine desulfurase [Aeromicrobium camelliae]
MSYLDEAATAPVRREVLEAMWPYLTQQFANPASQHEPGKLAARALEDARARVAARLGARPSEIVFTSGGTEADNAAIKGVALAAPRGRHVLVSAVEHPAVLESAGWLKRWGFELEEIPVDREGVVSPQSLRELIRPDTTLVSIQYANNEVGTVQDIAALAEVAAEHQVPFHTDAVQAAGSLDLDVERLGVQAMSLAGHKIGTPKGIGALYLRRRVPFEPLVHGGGQQRGRRSGTENVAAAVAMAVALETNADSASMSALSSRRDRFVAEVLSAVPTARLTGHLSRRLPGNASFVFPGRSGESILLDLEQRGIYCSSGSACAAGEDEPSHVLTAMGYEPAVAQTAVRFTFGTGVSDEELAATVDALRHAATV